MSGYQPIPFHVLLKMHREVAGISEDELAYQIGCTPEIIKSVERGAVTMPPELLVIWAECLNTSPYYLALRHLNEVAAKYCRRAKLDCSLSVSLTPSITGGPEYGFSSSTL